MSVSIALLGEYNPTFPPHAEVRVIEYPGHQFFIGTLFVPQTRSTPETPHPLVTAFLKAVIDRAA